MGDHIKPEGWNNWRNPANEFTARFSEFNSTGLGANPEQRVKWSKQLAKEEAAKITVESVWEEMTNGIHRNEKDP